MAMIDGIGQGHESTSGTDGSRYILHPLTPATPAGDEGPPKTFLPALSRQRNDGNRAVDDILYREIET